MVVAIGVVLLLLIPVGILCADSKSSQNSSRTEITSSPSKSVDVSKKPYRLAWCPDVICKDPSIRENSSEPDLCRQKWLFILSTGRSGSTSILETLNALSSVSNVTVQLRGEHAGAMTDLVYFVETSPPFIFDSNAVNHTRSAYFKQLVFKQIQQIFKDIDPPASSSNITNITNTTYHRHLSESSSTNETARLAELLAVQLRHKEERKKTFILGFKEIRYNYESHVHFLKTVFPCSRIIFNHRLDTEAQSKSAFYKKDGTPLAALEAKKLEMERLSRLYPASSMLLPLEALKPHNFTALLQWLGFQNCAVRWLCHSNHQTYSDRSCNITNMVSGTCGIDLERRAY